MTTANTSHFAPWTFPSHATDAERTENARILTALRAAGHVIGADTYVAPSCVVEPPEGDRHLSLGDRSYLAGWTHVSGDVAIGADCSLNVFASARGTVRIGDGVRIGAHTSILGFDHGHADPDVPIRHQPHTSRGITIGDDVWIGAQVVILDGVTIGAHSIIGAGAVVTKSVPAHAIAAGNPARVIRDRRTGAKPATPHKPVPDGAASLRAVLASFAATARAQAPAILERAWDGEHYRDHPEAAPTVRAHGDAVELADLLLGAAPPQVTQAEHVARLAAGQDAATGLIPELGADVSDEGALGESAYHVLSVGYALDLLGGRLPHPLPAFTSREPADLLAWLEALDWERHAWGAGAAVDTLGTALTWADEAGHPVPAGAREALVGWLLTRREAETGLWGEAVDGDRREAVNGTYRLVRGTLAQWGVHASGGAELVDAVLRHVRRGGVLAAAAITACDALDVVHLLWWARTTGATPEYRRAEVRQVARDVADHVMRSWSPGEGLAFAPAGSAMRIASGADVAAPTLQGTEMWLATLWYAADLVDCADALGYRPRGIHRPQPR